MRHAKARYTGPLQLPTGANKGERAFSAALRSSYVSLAAFHFFFSSGVLRSFFCASGSARMASCTSLYRSSMPSGSSPASIHALKCVWYFSGASSCARQPDARQQMPSCRSCCQGPSPHRRTHCNAPGKDWHLIFLFLFIFFPYLARMRPPCAQEPCKAATVHCMGKQGLPAASAATAMLSQPDPVRMPTRVEPAWYAHDAMPASHSAWPSQMAGGCHWRRARIPFVHET